ncbi:hypothetical protein ACTXMF_12125 [Psychrobacter celer]|uniref:hypothetical protein n=1 Tax=Psychrobacter celer TaxID=306572 RepID=UPI003FD3E5F9
MEFTKVDIYPDLIPVFKIGVMDISDLHGPKYSGVITGKVLEQGVPVSRRVLCHQRDTGVLVGSTWSDANGNYVFNGLDDSKKYYVVSLDEDMSSTQYNAVVQDLIPANEVPT